MAVDDDGGSIVELKRVENVRVGPGAVVYGQGL